MNVAQQNDGCFIIDRGSNIISIDTDYAYAILTQQVTETMGYVTIGGELTAFDHDLLPRRVQLQSGNQQLKEVNRNGIASHDFSARGANHLCDSCPQSLGQPYPVRSIPSSNQFLTPLVMKEPTHRVRSSLGHGAKRVAI